MTTRPSQLWVPRHATASTANVPATPPDLLPPARDRRCPDGPTFRYVETAPRVNAEKALIGVARRWDAPKVGLHVVATVERFPLGDLTCLHVVAGHPALDLTQRQIRQVIRTFYGAAPQAVWQPYRNDDLAHVVHLWGLPDPARDTPKPTPAEEAAMQEALRHAAE